MCYIHCQNTVVVAAMAELAEVRLSHTVWSVVVKSAITYISSASLFENQHFLLCMHLTSKSTTRMPAISATVIYVY